MRNNNYNQRVKREWQSGFAFLPIIIVVAALIIVGGSGAVIYQTQKQNKAENDQANNQAVDFVEVSTSPSPEVTETPEPSSETEPTSLPASKPTVQGTTATKPVAAKSATTPTVTPTKQSTPSPVKPSPTPTPTPTPKPTTAATTNVVETQPTIDLIAEQQRVEQERIARIKQQLRSAIRDIDSQLAVLGQQMQEKQSEIDAERNRPVSVTQIERRTAPLIAALNALIRQYNSLIDERKNLVREILLL